MGFCILGGKENYLRKVVSDKLTALGQAINIGATATAFANAIQTIYDSRYTAGQDSLKTARKLTLTASQTGSNVDIADNWYTTCDASAVYAAGQASVKTSRKLTLSASQTGSNVDIADNWYTTCDASAVYAKGKTDGQGTAKLLWTHAGRGDNIQDDDGTSTSGTKYRDSSSATATKAQTVAIQWTVRNWQATTAKVSYFIGSTETVISNAEGVHSGTKNVSLSSGQILKLRCYGQDGTNGVDQHSAASCIVF